MDKYYGRALCVEGFKAALRDFLFNGARFLSELVPDIVSQLKRLEVSVRTLEGFRFYSSSLLIMYEGSDQQDSSSSSIDGPRVATKRGVDIKMIDFAHSSLPHTSTVRHKGPDGGYLFGLDNLIRLLEELLAAATTSLSSTSPSVATSVPV